MVSLHSNDTLRQLLKEAYQVQYALRRKMQLPLHYKNALRADKLAQWVEKDACQEASWRPADLIQSLESAW